MLTDSKLQIIKKTEPLFLKYGLKSVSMDDIAKELGISKKTLYQSFENKAELIQSIFEVHFEEEQLTFHNIIQESPDAIAQMLAVAKYVIEKLKSLTPTLLYDLNKYYQDIWEPCHQQNKAQIYNYIFNNIQCGIQQGLYRSDINADIIAKLYVGKSDLIINENHFPSAQYNKEWLFRQLFSYHIRGIASQKGIKLLDKYLEEIT